jgi:hypothetical protein
MRSPRIVVLIEWLFGIALLGACSSKASDSGRGSESGDLPTAPPPGAGAGGAGDNGQPVTGQGSQDGTTGPDGSTSPAAVPYVPFDVNHVISTGQSNSVAHEARTILTTTQPFSNLMFDVGVMTSGVCEAQGCRTYQKPTAFVPLVEGDSFWYPVETMSSALANEGAMLATTKYAKPGQDILVSLAGRNGLTYWCLRKGGCNFIDPTYVNAFEENMRQVTDAKAIAAAAGKSYVVRMATAIHGESDDYAYATGAEEFPVDGTDGTPRSITSYADGLIEWQRDYETGVKAITGQAQAVPLLISQFSGWNDIATSRVSMLQYEAHVRAPGKVVLVTPAYTLDWDADCRHYTSKGERQLGEYFGKAYARIVLEGLPWEPVRPSKVTHVGNVVTASYVVPVPPLVLDTERVVDPGHYGYEVVDEGGTPIAITNVALGGPDSVTITLANAPTGKAHLRYAFTGVPHTCPGASSGPRGNLRDSDNTPSHYGYSLFNWGVHFDVAIE